MAPDAKTSDDAGGRIVPSFAAERQAQDVNLFEAVVKLLRSESKAGRKTVIACWSEGSRDRMAQVLADHGLAHPRMAENWRDAETTSSETTALTVLGLFVLRYRQPGLERPYRVPAYPLIPALYLAVAAFFLVFIAVGDPRNAGLGTVVMLSGVPVYFFLKRR